MSNFAQSWPRAIGHGLARAGSSSAIAFSSRLVIKQPARCCSRSRLYSSTTLASPIAESTREDHFDPYPSKSDQDLLACLQPSAVALEEGDIYAVQSLPIDCASAYICLRLRPGFSDIFPQVPASTLVDLLISCSSRGLSRVASHLVDDVLRYRINDLGALQATLAIPARHMMTEVNAEQAILLYRALVAATGSDDPELSFNACKRIIRAFIHCEEEDGPATVARLLKTILDSPQPPSTPPRTAWIACEAVTYLASEEEYAEAVPLLQTMILKKLLPDSAIQEMQLVDRSHPRASGIVILSATMRVCMEWLWLERALLVLERLRVDCLEVDEARVPTTTMELVEELIRMLLISNDDNVIIAGNVLISISSSSRYPHFSQSLINLFYRRALDRPIMVEVFQALGVSQTPQPSPPAIALDSLCRYFTSVDESKRSVSKLMPYIRRADQIALVPYRASLLTHLTRVGCRQHAVELYTLWADDRRSIEMLANSKVMLSLVKAFTEVEKHKSRPFNITAAQTVIKNYLGAIPGVSVANIAHLAALRLARAFFLVGSNSAALKLFDNILLDRAQGIDSADVGALIVSVANTRPKAAADMLERANRWGVRLDGGTYARCVRVAVEAGDIKLAKAIEASADAQDVEMSSVALEEAYLLDRIEHAKPVEYMTVVQDIRRARQNPYRQVSDRAYALIISKAAEAREWRAGIEAWRSRLTPKRGQKLPMRAEIIGIVEPLLSALEAVIQEGRRGPADYVYSIRDILLKQPKGVLRDQLLARCRSCLQALGMVVK